MGDATFNYSAASYCTNDVLQTPTITGTAGGSFTVTPATGLTVDPATGEFDPSTATTGAYDITYTTAGGCVGTETVNVTINPIEDASFMYTDPFCINGVTDPTPTSITTPGGTFTNTTGVMFVDATTGEIDLSTSSAGPHTITYTTACLLYTSPSPRDRTRSRMPSSA